MQVLQAGRPELAPIPSGTDDTATLTEMANDLDSDGGGQILLRSDTYISDGLALGSNTTVAGQSEASVIQHKAGSANDLLTLKTNATINVDVTDLTIEGNRANQTNPVRAIFFDHTGGDSGIIPRHSIINVKVNNVKGDGVVLGAFTRGSKLDQVDIYFCDGRGLALLGADSKITNVDVGQSGVDGVEITGNAYQLSTVKSWNSGRLGSNGRGFLVAGQQPILTNCEAQENRAHGFLCFRSGTVLTSIQLIGCKSDGDGTIANQVGFNLFNTLGAVVQGTVTKFAGAAGTPANGLAIAGGAVDCDVVLTVNNQSGDLVSAGSTIIGNYVRINGDVIP